MMSAFLRAPGVLPAILPAILLAAASIPAPAATDSGTASGEARNRLAGSQSPYLLLHADNPVDWYPWGPEAFERARAENKPVFLSVGYSTCFWCHVAERTLFSDPEIAALMNRYFINVKVDREQRPDVDQVYMLARQMLTGSGGWPNNVFLTPDRKPFFAGSYFPPKRDDLGRAGFPEVMAAIHDAWVNRRADVMANVERVEIAHRQLRDAAAGEAGVPKLEPQRWKNTAIRGRLARFDARFGGFRAGRAVTKFPVAPTLMLLLEEYRAGGDQTVREVLAETLDAIALGGIHDHLAGGFHRYSTDRRWSVPHFEKMLYDNAQLLRVYAEAHQVMGTPLYRHVATSIAGYLVNRMMAPGGGFYTAEDAQVDGVEGASYVWSREQIKDALGDEAANAFLRLYSLSPLVHTAAALQAAAAPVPEGGAVLRIRMPLDEVLAEGAGKDIVTLIQDQAQARRTLLGLRDGRKAPLRDDKLGLDLNGMAIDGFARAGRALGEPRYVELARQTAERLWELAWDDTAMALSHQVFEGKASGGGLLTDHAHFARGLLALHEVTGETRWLDRARALGDAIVSRFVDERGGLRMSLAADELPVSIQDHGDNEAPSASSAALEVLVALAAATGEERFGDAARAVFRFHAPGLSQRPDAWPAMLTALQQPPARTMLASMSTPASLPVTALEDTADQIDVHTRVSTGSSQVFVTLKVKDGYHINANPASLDFLIPTTLTFDDVQPARIDYPESRVFRPSFTDAALDVYEGDAVIVATFEPGSLPATSSLRAEVRAQACNETVCLPPATLPVTFDR